jgi:hypothetical protein
VIKVTLLSDLVFNGIATYYLSNVSNVTSITQSMYLIFRATPRIVNQGERRACPLPHLCRCPNDAAKA